MFRNHGNSHKYDLFIRRQLLPPPLIKNFHVFAALYYLACNKVCPEIVVNLTCFFLSQDFYLIPYKSLHPPYRALTHTTVIRLMKSSLISRIITFYGILVICLQFWTRISLNNSAFINEYSHIFNQSHMCFKILYFLFNAIKYARVVCVNYWKLEHFWSDKLNSQNVHLCLFLDYRNFSKKKFFFL